jgi:Major intrinsic protein
LRCTHCVDHRRLTRYAPRFVALVTVSYFALSSSISGFSVNPAKSFSSALVAWIWHGIVVAPWRNLVSAPAHATFLSTFVMSAMEGVAGTCEVPAPGGRLRERDHVDLLWSAACSIKCMNKKKSNLKSFGPSSGDQAGDDQGLPDTAEADSESVKELVDEGQPFEASAVDGVEGTHEPEESGVRTRQVPEDDVPPEYLEQD